MSGTLTIGGLALGRLMPLHIRVDAGGRICGTGPTLARLCRQTCVKGALFSEAVRLLRPALPDRAAGLDQLDGRKVRLSLSCRPDVTLNGTVAALPEGGVLIDLALSVTGIEAIGRIGLSLSDFAVTDQTANLLYLQEINAHILGEWRALTDRQQVAHTLADRKACTDSLTTLGNRRGLHRLLGRLTSPMDPEPFGLLHVDLDRFKQVNDSFGHGAGDAVLRHVGRILRQETREHDFLARTGGDEFTVVLRLCEDRAELHAAAARILGALSEKSALPALCGPVMASIGSTLSADYLRPDAERMLSDADRALYRSKHEGRGRHSTHQRQEGERKSDDKAAN